MDKIGKMRLRNLTYETLIKVILESGFEIIDYIDARPTKEIKKIDEERYNLLTRLPTFIVFKLKKKYT